jgi:hypothetical protein
MRAESVGVTKRASGLSEGEKRAAFDSARRFWQGARPDDEAALDFGVRDYHQLHGNFSSRPPAGSVRTVHG